MQFRPGKSCGSFGFGQASKYSGDAAIVMRNGGPMGAAIMFVDGGAQTCARVEAVGYDVPKTVIHVELHLDVGILTQQRRKLR